MIENLPNSLLLKDQYDLQLLANAIKKIVNSRSFDSTNISLIDCITFAIQRYIGFMGGREGSLHLEIFMENNPEASVILFSLFDYLIR